MPTQFVDDTLVVEYVASTCWPGVNVVLSRVRASPDAAQTVVSVGASSAIAATSSTASELHRETDLMRSLQTSRRGHPAPNTNMFLRLRARLCTTAHKLACWADERISARR